MGFAKIALVTIYMLQTLKTVPHIFDKKPNSLLKMFLGSIAMVKVPKNADICQILGSFFILLVKAQGNKPILSQIPNKKLILDKYVVENI